MTLVHEFQNMRCGECAIEFYVPDWFYKERKEEGEGWSCPNGHRRIFKEPEIDQLRRERDRLKQETARLEDEAKKAWGVAAAERLQAEKAKKETAKVKKRAISATCPCCNRSFANVARHMKSKHPEVTPLPARRLP